MQKIIFVFLAVAICSHLATAYNCTALDGENKRVCDYIERQSWSQSEKDSVIQEMINDRGTLNGDFVSITTRLTEEEIQLNKMEVPDSLISDENKEFLIDFSSISLFGYIIYSFIKKYYLLQSIL
jgi:hypothetical protein